ncbi:unnamed protein product [Dimorphilus gyrociliatus]|uniref:Sister chromatid cohesion protein DCC1 n=1 Tax=Dimorphilus gyrociliatus TaxID=2664684 RepID=A0A7I8VS70_9ANNE|nr:unnamed protein product [Dimorphilus gyrociliatus]
MASRTSNEIKETLKLAKIEESDLKSFSQTLYFSKEFSSSEYSLVELPPDVVLALKNQDEVCIRGRKDDNAILCTKSNTYTVKEAEVSNSMLLSDNLTFPDGFNNSKDVNYVSLNSLNFNYYELKKTVANKRRIEQILKDNPYIGKSSEKNMTKYTTEDLKKEIQASEREILKGLEDIKACEIEGYWRLINIDYIKTILDAIINFKEENSWEIDEIDFNECSSVLGEIYPSTIIEHIIKSYLKREDETNRYTLRSEEFVKFIAIYLLTNAAEFNLKEFLTVWKQLLPEGIADMAKASLLNGIALVRDQGIPSICYFPISKLPEKVDERFSALFQMKEKWKFDEILPYIRDLDDDESKLISILNKYTRSSQVDGVKMYSHKHI